MSKFEFFEGQDYEMIEVFAKAKECGSFFACSGVSVIAESYDASYIKVSWEFKIDGYQKFPSDILFFDRAEGLPSFLSNLADVAFRVRKVSTALDELRSRTNGHRELADTNAYPERVGGWVLNSDKVYEKTLSNGVIAQVWISESVFDKAHYVGNVSFNGLTCGMASKGTSKLQVMKDAIKFADEQVPDFDKPPKKW